MLDDSSAVSADLLHENITHALFAAEPALKNDDVRFDDFCEYVLPYRVDTEPLENWRKIARDSFAAFALGKPVGRHDYVAFSSKVNNYLRQDFTYQSNNSDQRPWSAFISEKSGNCSDMARMVMYPLRAFGIPVSYDFTNCWGNVNGFSRTWNALIVGDGVVPFLGNESNRVVIILSTFVLQQDRSKSSSGSHPKFFAGRFSN